jgi:uncharacterized protein
MAVISTPVSAQAWCELHQWGITEERVTEAVRRIVAACAPERVIAFGSWARGEARPESDLDLAVIVDEQSDVAASRHLPAILAGIRMSKDILVVDRREHERMKVSRNSVHHFIATDGVVLYERLGSATEEI